MLKAKVQPVYFAEINEREKKEYEAQMQCLHGFYDDVAEFLPPILLGEEIPAEADVVGFPQMIFAAFRHDDLFKKIDKPMIVLTSKFGTVEMWDWEIITYLRDLGCEVFSPYSVDLAKTILRAFAVKAKLADGAKFVMYQDTPGEGMQANIFKKFYWWEKQSTEKIEQTFGPVDKVIIPEQIPANMTHTRWRKQKKRGLNHPLEVQGHDGKETFLSHSGNASFPDFGQAMFSLQNGETTLCPDFSQTHH